MTYGSILRSLANREVMDKERTRTLSNVNIWFAIFQAGFSIIGFFLTYWFAKR